MWRNIWDIKVQINTISLKTQTHIVFRTINYPINYGFKVFFKVYPVVIFLENSIIVFHICLALEYEMNLNILNTNLLKSSQSKIWLDLWSFLRSVFIDATWHINNWSNYIFQKSLVIWIYLLSVFWQRFFHFFSFLIKFGVIQADLEPSPLLPQFCAMFIWYWPRC